MPSLQYSGGEHPGLSTGADAPIARTRLRATQSPLAGAAARAHGRRGGIQSLLNKDRASGEAEKVPVPATGTGIPGPDAAAQILERGREISRTLMDGCSDLGRAPNPDGTGIAGLSFNGSVIGGTSPEPRSARTDVWCDADRGEGRGRACESSTGHALDRSGQGTPGIGIAEPVISSGGVGPPNAVRTDPLGGTNKFRAVQGGSGASPPRRLIRPVVRFLRRSPMRTRRPARRASGPYGGAYCSGAMCRWAVPSACGSMSLHRASMP